MPHYVGSWIGHAPPRGQTACGIVVFKTDWSGDMLTRAKTLLDNTKKVRFFRGELYDEGADKYLVELHSFLADFIAASEQHRP